MHGPSTESQWGWHCESLALETHRWGTQNLPQLGRGSHPLGEELELPEAPEAATSLLECPETPESMEPTEQINAPGTPAPPSPTPKPCHHPPRKQRNPSEGLRLTKASPAIGCNPILRRTKGYPTGGENSSPFSTPRMSPSVMFTSKN